jgi:hypothetical protein
MFTDSTEFYQKPLSAHAPTRNLPDSPYPLAAGLACATAFAQANPFEHHAGQRHARRRAGRPPRPDRRLDGLVQGRQHGRASGSTGVAHVLEHMMFKGTVDESRRPLLEDHRRGGRARERVHQQGLHGVLPAAADKSKLPIALGLEADRMQNLVIDAEEFAKEIRVVMEERRMRTDDQPRALLYEQLMSAAPTRRARTSGRSSAG